MLQKPNRLAKKKDFDEVFKRGRVIRDGFCVIRALQKKSGGSRFGFIVSKKVSLSAVQRNAIRRRLSSVAADQLQKLKSPFDIIIVALPSIKEKDFSQMRTVVEKLMSKVT